MDSEGEEMGIGRGVARTTSVSESRMPNSTKRKALALSLFTVVYNLGEGVVAMIASSLSSSTALLGFGLDSFVESLSGMVMVWRFWKYDPDADEKEFEQVERKASRLVAYSFFALGSYVVFEAGHALYIQETPETSIIGIALAIASLVIMPVLFYLKYRLGKSIGSKSLVADSKETLACVLLSIALLVGLGAYSIWKVWWIDSLAALVIAALILREGYETFQESRE
jgi:cation diffusion facilitator family transporter